MEKKNNFLILDQEQILQTDIMNSHFMQKFKIMGEEYYFKECNESECFCSLFCEIVAQFLDISTVHFDLARFQNKTGLLSKSFNSENLKETPLLNILESYRKSLNNRDFKKLSVDELNNLNDIWFALLYYYKGQLNKDYVANIYRKIIDTFILQVCIGSPDFHCENIFILGEELPFVAPNYDYDIAMKVKLESNIYPYALLPMQLSKEKKFDHKLIIELFLGMHDDFKRIFIEKISILPSVEDILLQLEARMGNPLNNYLVSFYSRQYESYYHYLKSLVPSEFKNKARY